MSVVDRPAIANHRAVRRLAFMLLSLIVLDPFIPSIVRKLEKRHYEGRSAFRFENSDLFGLGPLVSYLREHPRGDRRRAVFLGNSMMFGYLLDTSNALPAEFEKQNPGTRVFNMAVNGQETGSSYLISKAVIDSVDVIFVQVIGESVNPMLASLIPVDRADARRFQLQPPDPLEQRLKEHAGRLWRLYRFNQRIQAALFGTSTRQYLYMHKRVVARALLRLGRKPVKAVDATPAPPVRPSIIAPRAPVRSEPRKDLSRGDAILRDLAELARSHRKRVVLLTFEYGNQPPGPEIAELNATYAPFAERVVVMVPPTLTYDGQHLTEHGCRLVADALARHEREAGQESRR
jgi:hypothetical protein